MDKPEAALYDALKEACALSKSSVHRHVIVENLSNDKRKWQATVVTLHQPAQPRESADSHLFIRERDEPVFRGMKKKFSFEYIHVTPEGKFWDCVLRHHPDMEFYKATHSESSEGEEGEGDSGTFSRPKLDNDIIQAFSSKKSREPEKPQQPDLDGPH